AGVFCAAVNAGTIASSNGNDTAAPIPRSMVRREIAFLATIMILPSASEMACSSQEPKRLMTNGSYHLQPFVRFRGLRAHRLVPSHGQWRMWPASLSLSLRTVLSAPPVLVAGPWVLRLSFHPAARLMNR